MKASGHLAETERERDRLPRRELAVVVRASASRGRRCRSWRSFKKKARSSGRSVRSGARRRARWEGSMRVGQLSMDGGCDEGTSRYRPAIEVAKTTQAFFFRSVFQPFAQLPAEIGVIQRQPALVDQDHGGTSVEACPRSGGRDRPARRVPLLSRSAPPRFKTRAPRRCPGLRPQHREAARMARRGRRA